MSEPERPLTVTGVDGCAAGWVAVTLGSPVTGIVGVTVVGVTVVGVTVVGVTVVGVTVAATLDRLPLAPITGIDMPLGVVTSICVRL